MDWFLVWEWCRCSLGFVWFRHGMVDLRIVVLGSNRIVVVLDRLDLLRIRPCRETIHSKELIRHQWGNIVHYLNKYLVGEIRQNKSFRRSWGLGCRIVDLGCEFRYHK
jgi:hypothetical protein